MHDCAVRQKVIDLDIDSSHILTRSRPQTLRELCLYVSLWTDIESRASCTLIQVYFSLPAAALILRRERLNTITDMLLSA